MSVAIKPSDGRRPSGGAGIKTQINLPWSKAIQIAMNSLKIRFWRTSIARYGWW